MEESRCLLKEQTRRAVVQGSGYGYLYQQGGDTQQCELGGISHSCNAVRTFSVVLNPACICILNPMGEQ